jgi:hypothetical protein
MALRKVDDHSSGLIRATVEPSRRIGGNRTGIFMQVNDHYDITELDRATGSGEVMDVLESHFDKSIARSDRIIDQIMGLSDE